MPSSRKNDPNQELAELAAAVAAARDFLKPYAMATFHDEWCSTNLDGAPEEQCDCLHGRAKKLWNELADPSAILAAREEAAAGRADVD